MMPLTAHDFISAGRPEPLREDEIHLWFFPSVDVAQDGIASHREILLPLLGAYLQRAASALSFGRGEHGKPFIEEGEGLEFNLSHSAGALFIAVAQNQALGVDLEISRRARPALELARRYFDPSEAAALEALDVSQVHDAFLHLWSRKEAVLKAIGQGIGFGLARLCFDLDAAGQPMGLRSIDASAGDVAQWQVLGVTPAPGHLGALAWYGKQRSIRAFTGSGADFYPH